MSKNRYDEQGKLSINHSEYHGKRSSNNDAKVYVGNVPTDHLSDQELLDFFKPFGKILDIRVYKGYIFVQYENIDHAKNLIKQGESCLVLKGNKLDILPAMDVHSKKRKEKDSVKSSDFDQQSIDYEPPRKRCGNQQLSDQTNQLYLNKNHFKEQNSKEEYLNIDENYQIIKGSYDKNQLIHCRIILVNLRQKNYAEEICYYLENHEIKTSIILLRENYSLMESIEDAKNDHCLYAVVLLPTHQYKHTASFHILHEHIQEYRNISLKDGYDILIKHFQSYQEKSKKPTIENDKLPLTMLLCLLADGRQLTLEEVDRILVYLFEKKANLLNLPKGTIPPLPHEYANRTSIDQSKWNSLRNANEATIPSDFLEQLRNSSKFSSLSKESNSASEESYSTRKINHFQQNFSASNAAAAIFQAYSQLNCNPVNNLPI